MNGRKVLWIGHNMEVFLKYVEHLVKIVPKSIQKVEFKNNGLVLYLDSADLVNFLYFLKYHTNLQYKILVDLTCVDYVESLARFEITYSLLSIKYNSRLRLKVYCSDSISISSIQNCFSNAVWLEREVWDLFGVFFKGNRDLRRILTDYGFDGFPLRKDFPLSGYVEVRYDELKKSIVYESLELTQAYRNFHFLSPWEFNKNTKVLKVK